jgi:1,4-alpha-glucan branching enzyme
MYTHPGKKLLFMGSELGQGEEWNSAAVLDWYVLEYPFHQGIQKLVRTLNGLHRSEAPLHAEDFEPHGFEWIDCHDAHNSVLVYQRRAPGAGTDAGAGAEDHLVVVLNFTPVPREGYRIGTPAAGPYREIFNSDAPEFGGSGMGNGSAPIATEAVDWMNRPNSMLLTLPPLAGIVLKPTALPEKPVGVSETGPTD